MKYVPPINGDQADGNRSYINGDAAQGIEGSIPPAEAFEHPMREILAVITGAGLTPDGADLSQLYEAIQVLANPNHTHAIAAITGLQAALGGKAALDHTHGPTGWANFVGFNSSTTFVVPANVTEILAVVEAAGGGSTGRHNEITASNGGNSSVTGAGFADVIAYGGLGGTTIGADIAKAHQGGVGGFVEVGRGGPGANALPDISYDFSDGSHGGKVTALLDVTPGQTLTLTVGAGGPGAADGLAGANGSIKLFY